MKSINVIVDSQEGFCDLLFWLFFKGKRLCMFMYDLGIKDWFEFGTNF
jgi:hypothetical protein